MPRADLKATKAANFTELLVVNATLCFEKARKEACLNNTYRLGTL